MFFGFQGENNLIKGATKYILSTPVLAISLFFMWLCGIVLSFLLIRTNPKFEKHEDATNVKFFNLALGFLPGAIVLIIYHLAAYRSFLTTLTDLTNSVLPSSLILAGITCIILFYKTLKS